MYTRGKGLFPNFVLVIGGESRVLAFYWLVCVHPTVGTFSHGYDFTATFSACSS